MSTKRKKLDKRLDRLFDEIKQTEADTQSDLAEEAQGKKEKKARKQSSSKRVPDPSPVLSDYELGKVTELPLEPDDIDLIPRSMLATAFRTDDTGWATLKVEDETEERVWGKEEQLLIKQVADQLSLALENARLFHHY